MKRAFSVLVLATSFALLVPDNRAQALGNAAEHRPVTVLAAGQGLLSAPAVSEASPIREPATSPEMSWVLALGFLGVVVARRLRVD